MSPLPITRGRALLASGLGSPYADISATSPDLLVPLKYASTAADGQILFQDSLCTVPVESIGDPVGGVKWRGVIVATQSTDADRPTWQGDARGVNFDAASGQFLVSAEANTLSSATGFTLVARANGSASPPDQQTLFRARPLAGFGAASGIAFTWEVDTSFSSGASPYEDTAGNAYTLNDAGSVGALAQYTFVIDKSSALARKDGADVTTNFTVQSGSLPLGTISLSDCGIGASDPSGTPQRFFHGDMEVIALYADALSSVEYTDAEAGVNAI